MSTLPPCYGIIPARWASSRFPGKPLAPILGKPMVWHVWERAGRCAAMRKVALATDDARIMDAAAELGMPAILTRADHASGTDRVLEAALALGVEDDAVVVNIQGDEPALDPAMLDALTAPFADPAVRVATLAAPLSAQEAASADRVKVVLRGDGRALYFSRAVIPHDRDGGGGDHLLHVGLYAFRMATLRQFAAWPPSPLERREKLEQLRLLENGIDIHVVVTGHRSHGVDRPEDIALVEKIMTEQGA